MQKNDPVCGSFWAFGRCFHARGVEALVLALALPYIGPAYRYPKAWCPSSAYCWVGGRGEEQVDLACISGVEDKARRGWRADYWDDVGVRLPAVGIGCFGMQAQSGGFDILAIDRVRMVRGAYMAP
jgi:hypothetical protein